MLNLTSLKALFELWPVATSLIGNGYFFVIATTLLTSFLIGLCVMIKYTPHLMTDLRNLSGGEVPETGLKLWVVFILLLPLFFHAGPLWYALWWFIIFWVYVNKAERPIAYILLALVFMSGWIVHIGAGFISYADTQVNREIFCVDRGIAATKDTLALDAWVQKNPADAEAMNMLALVELDRQNHTRALDLLKRAIDLEPNNPRYYNHLGITLAALEKNKKAIQAFTNSAALDPDNMVYHYNLNRLHQTMYNFHEAEQAIARASAIDPSRVRFYLDREAGGNAPRYIREHIPVMSQISRQMHQSNALSAITAALWNIGLGIFGYKTATLLALAVLLVLVILGHLPAELFTKRCARCGNLYYAGTTSQLGLPLCLQCHWIDTKSKKTMGHILHSKAEEIKQYRSSISTHTAKLDLILPGLGALAGNKTSLAVFRLTVFSAAIVMLISGGHFITPFIPTGIELQSYMRLSGLALLALSYWRAFKSPPMRYGS